jgi:hypothetical protein
MTDEVMVNLKDWVRGALRSRTMYWNVLLAVLAGLELFGAHLTTLFGAKAAAAILLIGGAANIALRAITTTPLPHR